MTEVNIEDTKKDVALSEAFQRLCKNRDFKYLILEVYLKEYALQLVQLKSGQAAIRDKTLMELNLRKKYSINIVAVIENDQVIVNIDPEKPLKKEMSLIVIADTAKLAKFR